jgi:hypothetical protein
MARHGSSFTSALLEESPQILELFELLNGKVECCAMSAVMRVTRPAQTPLAHLPVNNPELARKILKELDSFLPPLPLMQPSAEEDHRATDHVSVRDYQDKLRGGRIALNPAVTFQVLERFAQQAQRSIIGFKVLNPQFRPTEERVLSYIATHRQVCFVILRRNYLHHRVSAQV